MTHEHLIFQAIEFYLLSLIAFSKKIHKITLARNLRNTLLL